MKRLCAIPRLGAAILFLALLPLPGTAAEAPDLLRLRSGKEILIRPGWQASFEQGEFWFEYEQPRRLACTLPLEDIAEIETPDGTIYQNHYESPAVTYSSGTVLDVTGTIVEHGPRYPSFLRDTTNNRGWNSRTGRFEPP